MSTDIDSIWATLKDSSTCTKPNLSQKAKSIAHLWETKKPNQHKKKKERRTNNLKTLSKKPTQSTITKIVDKEEECKEQKHIPNLELPFVDRPFNGLNIRHSSLGDSDDESEDEAFIDNQRLVAEEDENSPRLTIQRIASLMQSEDLRHRIDALKTLLSLIKNFHDKIDYTVNPIITVILN